MKSIAGWWAAVIFIAACSDNAVPDAQVDGSTPLDAATDSAAPTGDASPPATPACAGTPYTSAPSGATCDPKRVERSAGLAGSCYGPPLGAVCDDLVVTVDAADASKVAAGFVCGSPMNGKATCAWSSDAAGFMLDTTSLEAACATTAAVPAAIVVCVVYGD